jgi:hypothetical protein
LIHDPMASSDVALRRLQYALASLQSIRCPCELVQDCRSQSQTAVDSASFAKVRFEYERTELMKDICFLCSGEAALFKMLEDIHDEKLCCEANWVNGAATIPLWADSIDEALSVMHAASEDGRFENFITDRDGTLNNYCDRYASSVQSMYNAVWTTLFARHCTERALVITAAPLGGRPDGVGLMDLCTMPLGSVTYAGSKGREFFDNAKQCVVEAESILPDTQRLLDELHSQLVKLCAEPKNSKFLLLGSGLQRKLGEVTMARNDPGKTVPELESCRFKKEVQKVIDEINSSSFAIQMDDTGTDLEMFPCSSMDNRPPFTKGAGVLLLDERLHLNIGNGPNLVCGDTPSDVPMIEAAIHLMKLSVAQNDDDATCAAKLAVLFIITPEQHRRTPDLATRVRSLCHTHGAKVAILPSPDVFIASLARFTKERRSVSTL